jgi:endonuclease/exonuclease/phosphatase family metal-dependent hydrolase
MRSLLLLFLAMSELTAAPLRVVFWNIEWFPGNRPGAGNQEAVTQIAKVVPALASLNPDIVGMMEILNADAARIAVFGLPGTDVQVASEFLDDAGEITFQQLILASRLPAVGAWWEVWKAGSAVTPKRGFAFAAYQPAPGQVLLVYCVHLKSNRGDLTQNIATREESVRQLLDHVAIMEKAYASMGKVAVIVGGDFNTSLDDPRFAAEKSLSMMKQAGFAWGWENIPFADRVTLPSSPSYIPGQPPFPDACFDHAFVKGLRVVSASAPVFPPEASDHRPVVIDVAWDGLP